LLAEGESVTLTEELKVKGSLLTLKRGVLVKKHSLHRRSQQSGRPRWQ
jgi:uncharacterized Zn ribbon protein